MAEADAAKKRKRPTTGAAVTPNKKVAFSKPASKGTKIAVEFASENETGARMIVASSPGLAPPKVSFNAYASAAAQQQVLLHSSQHSRLDYTATPSALDAGLSHYLAVFDPQTNRLQVVPAQHLNLRGTLRTTEEEEAEARKQSAITFAQQREELGREFGTKKAKKAILSKTENAITQGGTKGKAPVTATQTAILEAVGEATVGTASREDQEKALLASKPIPPPNLEAQNVEEVYSFDVLVLPHESKLIAVKDWIEATEQDQNVELSHRFPAFRVQKAVKSKDVEKIKALRYVALLLEFHDVLSGGKVKKVPQKNVLQEKLSDYPTALVDAVRRRFTTDSGNELGKFQLDKLYTHICALSLFVDGFSTDTTHLKDDLKLDTRVVAKYYQELGCVVKAPTETERTNLQIPKNIAAATRIARLKLPLRFPKVSRRRA